MNAVKAIPCRKSTSKSHLVVAADSDGDLHIVVVPEEVLPRRTIIGKVLKGNGRPILCLGIVDCIDFTLVFTGNTAGEIAVWNLSAYCDDCSDNGCNTDVCLRPLITFHVHSSGVNDLSLAKRNTSESVELVCCSVGDDQSLSAQSFTFARNDDKVQVTQNQIDQTQRCASPLKAVDVTYDDKSSFCLVYTTGQDEFITLWRLEFQPFAIKYLTSSSLGTEGSCIDCMQSRNSFCFEQQLIAVGGEGIEVQSLNYSAITAAQKLRDANYLLITAGAGFSADSGLSTYECAPTEYKELCNPSQLIANAGTFQRFWLKFTRSYRQTKPHAGYDLIDRWCSGGLLKHLVHGDMSPWWVYTSNVDGHFSRFDSFQDAVCEIHGSSDEYICSCLIGYSDGQPRIGEHWRKWNKKASKTCRQSRERLSDDDLDRTITDPQADTLKCKDCQLPLRPNVLMFNDTDENVLEDIAIQRDRYQAWERRVEEAIARDKSKLVILELGCGVNVPAVRQESEEVLSDCTEIIELQTNGAKASVCLIRINPKNAEVDDLGRPCESISIQANAKEALVEIDFWLRNMVDLS
jgi:NAD-dependent SIR2 family protein deacetylase